MFDHSTAEQHVDDEVAALLLFVPIKYPKSGRLNEKKLKEWVEKRRTAS
ncbi:hypothetical protein [Dickeya solani]|uniref:AMP-binding enzyme C-terminal domain-containing protein n=1 Tax=Dickeya solani TaxID=1089444 RepID=A0ABU4EBU7_9GAMM|nr:hypothetical protein [Dickeya solani]MCA6998466.1 hypothetical protein [Dickeya solani]MDV7039474.1 hypothetical protein [Dickeya solani]MDV7040995.1 hypothetical protein [Dickeya solani]